MSSEPGRVLGIDYGQRRVGLALSDPGRILAGAYKTLERTSDRRLVAAIVNECAACDARHVVVGLPLNMNGSLGPAAAAVLEFIERLRANVSIPVSAWDERCSTRSAREGLIRGGARRRRRRQLVDAVAAQVLLQGFLDAVAGGRAPGLAAQQGPADGPP